MAQSDDDDLTARVRGGLGDELFEQLMEAIGYAGGTHTLVDVARGVLDGRYQIIHAGRSVVISEVLDYPHARALHIFLAAGNLDDLYSLGIERAEALARQVGADRMTVVGRHGWGRSAQKIGFKPTHTMLTKHLDKE